MSFISDSCTLGVFLFTCDTFYIQEHIDSVLHFPVLPCISYMIHGNTISLICNTTNTILYIKHICIYYYSNLYCIHVCTEWTPEEVAERFLKPCGMERLAKCFIDSNITGSVLIALQESHLKELGCDLVGDRLTLMDYLHVREEPRVAGSRHALTISELQ